MIANAKFGETQDKLGPRVNVLSVYPKISPSDFINHLYVMNHKSHFSSREEFDKKIHFVSQSWIEASKDVTVVLEGTKEAMGVFLNSAGCMLAGYYSEYVLLTGFLVVSAP